MRKGGEKRGNTRNRRARKLWLLATFDPELGDDMARCRLVLSDRCLGLLDYATITADRIVRGGSYARGNIRPACGPCQHRQGGLATVRFMAPLLEEYRAVREAWEVRFDLEANTTYRPGVIAEHRRKERRGGRREVTDFVDENPPPMFREWLSDWHASRREQGVN